MRRPKGISSWRLPPACAWEASFTCSVRALDLATRANARRLAVDVNEALSRWCEARGDLQEALERYKCYHQLNDELVRAELAAAYRARKLWLDFQQTRREAKIYKDRFDSLARDHEELANRSTGLIRAAFEDSLTGLSNRRHLDVRLTELTESIRGNGLRLAVAILDIDFFKQINDRFSHGVGDEVLRSVAAMIRTHCREGDVSARFGGDEFVICFIGTSINAAMVIVERLRSFVENHGWNTTQPGLTVRVSVGVTQARPGDDATALLARADAALYRAKESGRNQVCVE